MFFDIIFFTQHYVLYPGKEGADDVERGPEDAQALLAADGSVQINQP